MVKSLHLGIGEIIVSPVPSTITTVLGSCISVCLFSKSKTVGGMIHYALPQASSQSEKDQLRYGEFAIPALIYLLSEATGQTAQEFSAKIVGGASSLKERYDVGQKNIEIASELLKRANIPIIGKDVGGNFGRKAIFHPHTGRLQVASLETAPQPIVIPELVTKAPAPAAQRPAAISKKLGQSEALPRKKKVLVVDDSKTIRELLRRILNEDPELEVIGCAEDAAAAEDFLKRLTPDVITLDIHMPGMTGVQWLEGLLPRKPIPVVMVSSLQLQEGNEVFRALELGAVDYVQKPNMAQMKEMTLIIKEKVKAAAEAKVRPASVFSKPVQTANSLFSASVNTDLILAMGASTGGTEALREVLMGLPANIPPIVIVQHIPAVFSKAFADRLNELCAFEVKEASDGDEVRAGRALIAPGGKQMALKKAGRGYIVTINEDPPVNRHKPSVDYLFRTVASLAGSNAIGVILTGMGNDGADGLLKMKNAGARTMAQDEASSVVYGMPRVAFELGATQEVHSLENISNVIIQWASKKAA